MSEINQPTSEHILRHLEDGVLTLTLNRPDRKNAFTQAMYRQFTQELRSAAAAAEVRVVVIQGQLTFFSAGNDIEDFLASIEQPDDGEPKPVFTLLRELAQFPKPVLAAVCGPAVGIGTTMLLHCDLVYAGDNAVFALPFVNLGLCPEAGSSLLLPQLMGARRAAEALLMGEPFYAEAALEVGFINKILPPTEVHDVVRAQALKLAAKPIQSVLETKRMLRAADLPATLDRIDEEALVLDRLLRQPAAKEAFTAFLEKRKPDFSAANAA